MEYAIRLCIAVAGGWFRSNWWKLVLIGLIFGAGYFIGKM